MEEFKMKKLLDREPTEEMLKALCAVKGMNIHTYREWWIEHFHALFDAAPELTVDMEPIFYVAWDKSSKHEGEKHAEIHINI